MEFGVEQISTLIWQLYRINKYFFETPPILKKAAIKNLSLIWVSLETSVYTNHRLCRLFVLAFPHFL